MSGNTDDADTGAAARVHQQAARGRVHRRLLPRQQPQRAQATRRRPTQAAAIAS